MGEVLSSDRDFTVFLGTRDMRRLDLERFVISDRVVIERMYEAETGRLREVLAGERTGVVVHKRRRRKQYQFTDEQLEIAIAVLAKQEEEAA